MISLCEDLCIRKEENVLNHAFNELWLNVGAVLVAEDRADTSHEGKGASLGDIGRGDEAGGSQDDGGK